MSEKRLGAHSANLRIGHKGRPFGSRGNPLPTPREFNPRIYDIEAGNLRLNSTMHPTNPLQGGPVSRLPGSELGRFRLEDPISSHGLGPGGSLNVTGGHHRLAEIIRRVQSGELAPDTIVRVLLHD